MATFKAGGLVTWINPAQAAKNYPNSPLGGPGPFEIDSVLYCPEPWVQLVGHKHMTIRADWFLTPWEGGTVSDLSPVEEPMLSVVCSNPSCREKYLVRSQGMVCRKCYWELI